MNGITAEYLGRAECWLLITTLAYFLLNGAQLFETAVLIPKWSLRPPASLSALQGPFAPDLKTFWIIAHCIHELTFILAIVFCWQIPAVKTALLVIFILHFTVRVWTTIYFAPRIISFQKTSIGDQFPAIHAVVGQWRKLNYLRVGVFVVLSVCIVFVYIDVLDIRPQHIGNKQDQTMEQRLSVITLGVNNLAAQKEFYTTKIGWKPVAENKDIIFFKLNGLLFSLFDRKTLAKGSGVPAEGSGFRSLTLSYNVPKKEEVDKLYADLKGKGITMFTEPTDTPFGGYFFTFTDLENNVLEVAFNPYIPLDDQGNVITHNNIDNL